MLFTELGRSIWEKTVTLVLSTARGRRMSNSIFNSKSDSKFNLNSNSKANSMVRDSMDENGISEETEGRIVVLRFYFTVLDFIAHASVQVAQYRPSILTGRQSGQKLQWATGRMILLINSKSNSNSHSSPNSRDYFSRGLRRRLRLSFHFVNHNLSALSLLFRELARDGANS